MKDKPLYMLIAALGLSAAWACGSDGAKPGPSPMPDAQAETSAGGTAGGDAALDASVDASGGSGGGDAAATGGMGTGGGSGGNAGILDSGTEAAPTEDAGDGARPPHSLMGQAAYPPVPYPDANPHTDAKAMLGKILFWEEQVGERGNMACGTCHRASAGGSDPRANLLAARLPGPNGVLETQPNLESDDIRGGQGVFRCNDPDDDTAGLIVQVTGRKPPTYLDAMFAPDIFWDGRARRDFRDPDTGTLFTARQEPATGRWHGYGLESQAIGPPLSDVEMSCVGQNWPDIHAKLASASPLSRATPGAIPDDMKAFINQHGNYPAMFESVFGDAFQQLTDASPNGEINTIRFAFAIATHERRLTSDQTPWDRWNAGDHDAMTPTQVLGFELFMGKAKCNTCHAPPLFTNLDYHFIGFHNPDWDPGRFSETGRASDRGKMKTPTLRNVGLREPGGLLHRGDGAGHDLRTVMDLYVLGGFRDDPDINGAGVDGGGPGIDSLLEPVDLTQPEIDAIIDFMKNALTDPRVRNETPPFDRPRLGTEL